MSLTLRVNLTLSQQQHLLRSSKGPFTSLSLLILTIILQGRDYHNSHLKGRLWSRRLRNSLRTQEEEEARQEPGPRLFSTGLRPTFPTPRRLFVRRGLRRSLLETDEKRRTSQVALVVKKLLADAGDKSHVFSP